ncbi:FtsK/SpoIIIE family DNA translocase [Pararhizobium mangrovi]|nr:DNA translocase FtsK [Pararhizobium mangrovi]
MQTGNFAMFAGRSARPALPALIRRPLNSVIGLAILAALALGVLALATWNVADPSFSYASGRPPTNALGFAGAAFADLVMQFFGLATVIAILPGVAWSLSFLRDRPIDRKPRRAMMGIFGTILAAAVLSCLSIPATWPLPSGLGGVFGDAILEIPRFVLGDYPHGVAAMLIGAVLAAPAVWCLLVAAGLADRTPKDDRTAPDAADAYAYDEDDEEDDGAVAFGLVTHYWLTAKGHWRRVATLFGHRPTGPVAYEEPYDLNETLPREAAIPEVEAEAPAPVVLAPTASPAPAASRREPHFEAPAPAPTPDRAEPRHVAEPEWQDEPAPAEDDMISDEAFEAALAADDDAETTVVDETDGFDDDAFEAADEAPFELDRRPHDDVPEADLANERAEEVRRAPAPDRAPPAQPVPSRTRALGDGTVEERVRVAEPAAPPRPAEKPAERRAPPAAFKPASAGGFDLPPVDLLSEAKAIKQDPNLTAEALEKKARKLEGVLADFGVKGEIIHVRPGPVVTLYELEPAPGIKSSRVIGLSDDIARSMSAVAARVAVVPGRNAIGIELPNKTRETVYLRELIDSQEFDDTKARLAMTLGKTIGGESVIADLAKMPHLLVAGTTGSGKSVAVNTMILSLIYRLPPEKCRLIMIDPKMLELSVYDGIPHLLSPVVTDPKKAVVALKWTVREMEERYKKMSKIGVRNVDGFNARVEKAQKNGEAITRTVQTGFDRETGEAIYETEEFDLQAMPYIVVIIDEMADLMMVAGKDIEGAVQRLAQMARAAGIHVIMATQRPSVDVITGTIKANFPTRISFQVTSKIDSRTILGEQGAESLLGMGDMLYMPGGSRTQRVHGPFVSDTEVEDVVAYLKSQGVPEYLDAITDEDETEEGGGDDAGPGSAGGMADSDDPYDQAVAVVLRDGKASTSYIQRRLGIGYNRAASLIERMENEGVIGPANHAGKREILVPTEDEIDPR